MIVFISKQSKVGFIREVKVIVFDDTSFYSDLSQLTALALKKVLVFELKGAGSTHNPTLVCVSFYTVVRLSFVELAVDRKRGLFHKKILDRLSQP